MPRRFVVVRVLAAVLISLVTVNTSAFAQDVCFSAASFVESRSAADGNPLRGFFSYADSQTDTFPSSIEFQYFSLAQLNTAPNTFDWSAVDSLLSAVSARGRQLVFRVYLDYPGQPVGIPQWLLAAGLQTTSYTSYGGGRSPDYTNAQLRRALVDFVDALGRRYDGDNRIAFIQVGLLGIWGEWHTYVDSGPQPSMAPASVRTEVLQAYQAAFNGTRCVVSADELGYDEVGDPDVSQTSIGWHDDDFFASTCTADWGFQARLASTGVAGHQEVAPFGGEVQPSIQQTVLATQASADTMKQCIDAVKPSWLLYYALFNGLTAVERDRALVVSRAMGYNFVLTKVEVK